VKQKTNAVGLGVRWIRNCYCSIIYF